MKSRPNLIPKLLTTGLFTMLLVTLLGGLIAAPATAKKVRPEPLETASTEIPEHLLLDVGIELFNPGLPLGDAEELAELEEEEGIYADVRKAEGRFIAVNLMDTLQSSGFWGAVRILPKAADSVDLKISGTIVSSSGLELEISVRATDSTGKQWLEKTYKETAGFGHYRDDIDVEPFQNLYNTVANELRKRLDRRDADDLTRIRRVSHLRFARDLAPDAYSDHLKRDRRGLLEVERLPADGDPMIQRIDAIRHRDEFLIDTFSEHYTAFKASTADPYDQWRRFSFDEERARRKIKRQARTRQILGALAIAGAVFVGGDSRSSDAVRDVAILGGIEAIRSGINKAQEAKLHRESLRELASSFDAEVAPALVEVEGETLRLKGSAESQYDEWRQLLRRLFAEDTGRLLDPDGDGILELPRRPATAEVLAPPTAPESAIEAAEDTTQRQDL